jgi:hypothetical protein
MTVVAAYLYAPMCHQVVTPQQGGKGAIKRKSLERATRTLDDKFCSAFVRVASCDCSVGKSQQGPISMHACPLFPH